MATLIASVNTTLQNPPRTILIHIERSQCKRLRRFPLKFSISPTKNIKDEFSAKTTTPTNQGKTMIRAKNNFD